MDLDNNNRTEPGIVSPAISRFKQRFEGTWTTCQHGPFSLSITHIYTRAHTHMHVEESANRLERE